jgi:hypothetical protein
VSIPGLFLPRPECTFLLIFEEKIPKIRLKFPLESPLPQARAQRNLDQIIPPRNRK